MSTDTDQLSDSDRFATLVARNGRWPRWPRPVLFGYLCFLFFSVGLAMYLNMAADARGQPGLAFLAPLIELLTSHAGQLRGYYMPPRLILPACAVLLLLFGLFSSVRWLRPRENRAAPQWERWFVFAESPAVCGRARIECASLRVAFTL
jgi:hypothetical protein